MTKNDIKIYPAGSEDLQALNQVIDTAVMTWDLPERVKRLALGSYHYTEVDLDHYQIMLAFANQTLAGIIAWDRQPHQLDTTQRGLFVHGLYVLPDYWRQGIGQRLLDSAKLAALALTLNGILVKAHKEARGFFQAIGMRELPVSDAARDYAYRFWLAL